MSTTTESDAPESQTKGRRATTCKPHTKTFRKHYFTTGREINKEVLQNVERIIATPYRIPKDLNTLEDTKEFWRKEKSLKIKERNGRVANKHNHRSRLNLLWKRERMFVPDETVLPGRSITEDIDPDFFTIATNRPIKVKKSLREYLKDVRDCFLTRLQTGFHLDQILLMEVHHSNEMKKLTEVRKNFLSCLKGFEAFLEEDHVSSLKLLEKAKEESERSREKLTVVVGLRKELKNLEADVLMLEEQWRNCQMFQRFLYIIAPSEWRKEHDPDFGKEDIDPSIFDRFREFPGETKVDLDVKISKFKEDVKERREPALFFTDPQELLDILEELEKNNQIAFLHCKKLDSPAESMMSEVEKARVGFEKSQKILEEEIAYLTKLIASEEEKSRTNEKKLRETAYGLFRELITNEEYLTAVAYVEDTYEDAVAPNDDYLGIVEMIKEIELKYESLLLALDILPNDIMVQTTRRFYMQQRRDLKEAKKAERKVHQMEILLKRLSKSLEVPKKVRRERRIVRRSLPPEELMYVYEPPKALTQEEKDNLIFFGEKAKSDEPYRPLCI